MDRYRFVLTGGGTGGHVYPNIAIFEILKEKYPNSEFLYLGNRRGAESKILQSLALPIAFRFIHSRGLPGKIKSLPTIPALWHIFVGAIQSFFILRKFKPHLVIGTGGYVSAPVVLAATLLKQKFFLHEQNSVPGRLNLLMSRFATRIGISFESTKKFLPPEKTVFTGYPLRKSLFIPADEGMKKRLGIPEENKVLFVFSGSTGSRSINQAITEIIPNLLQEKNLTVIVSTGKSYSSEYKAYDETVKTLEMIGIPSEIEGKLIIKEYFPNIEEIYSISDLVIARAGAGSVKEIASLALPVVFIPKIDLPGDHQIMNAKEIERQGGCRIILEEPMNGNGKSGIRVPEAELLQTILELISHDDIRQLLRSNLQGIKKVNTGKIIQNEVAELLQGEKTPEAREIKIHYLHSVDEEKNYELFFADTTFGTSPLVDHVFLSTGDDFHFSIRFLETRQETKLLLRRIKGEIFVNGQKVARRCEISESDEISSGGMKWRLDSYSEKIRSDASPPVFPALPARSLVPRAVLRLVEFIREMLAAAVFGASRVVDIFAALFSIIQMLGQAIAPAAMERQFTPLFHRLFQRGPKKQAWKSPFPLIHLVLLCAAACTAFVIFFAPSMVRIFFPAIVSRGWLTDATRMIRWLSLSLLLSTIVSILLSLVQGFQRVFSLKNSAILLPVGVIVAILIFPHDSCALAYGLLIGGLMQTAFLLTVAFFSLSAPSVEFSYSPTFRLRGIVGRKYVKQMAPISAQAAITRGEYLVDNIFAATFPVGSLSILYFAQTVFWLPLALMTRIINRKILDGFAEPDAWEDKEKSRKVFIEGIANAFFLLVPLSILLVMLAIPIVSVLLQRGRFDSPAASHTAWILQFYALGLTGWGLQHFTMRFFSLRQEDRVHIALKGWMAMVHIFLLFALVKTPLRLAGIPLASSVSITIFAFIRIQVLKRRLVQEGVIVSGRELLDPMFKTLAAALFMICGILEGNMIFRYIHFSSPIIQHLFRLAALSFLGVAVYFLSSLVLKNRGVLLFRGRFPFKSSAMPIALLSPSSFMEVIARKPDAYRDEYRYKINLYLASRRWETRNVGVKLIGLFHDTAYCQYLIDLIRSRRECAFLRRNAVHSLRQLRIWNADIQIIMTDLLRDPYYEIRAAAILFLGENMPDEKHGSFCDEIRKKLRRGTWEEKIATLKWIARKGQAGDIPFLSGLYMEANSLIREELLELLLQFHRRKILSRDEVKDHIQKVLITSNHLDAEFRIKSILQRIQKEIRIQ